MPNEQIPRSVITPDFNRRAPLSLQEKVGILEKSLPEQQRASYEAFNKRTDEMMHSAFRRMEQDRSRLLKKETNSEIDRAVTSVRDHGRGPTPNPGILEHNARISAERNVAQRQSEARQKAETRILEQKYDYLKKAQPDHPLVKQIREAQHARDNPRQQFNHASHVKDFER